MEDLPIPVVEKATELEVFKPDGAGIRDAAIGAAVKTAKRMQDWESLSHAVDELIKLERQVISWWDRNVQAPGRKWPESNSPRTALIKTADAESRLKVKHQQISRWRKWLEDEGKYRTRLIGRAFQAAGLTPEANHGALGTGENEWYTPERYIEAARLVMGEIDLDPASSEIAQRTVKAAQFFTATQDGLRQRWDGRVWLNPPYSQPHIFNFIEKLITEATSGNVEQAIVLTHNSTDTLWFHRLEEIAASICFTKGRIGFLDEQGDSCAPTQGQAFFYCGENAGKFAEIFSSFGFIR